MSGGRAGGSTSPAAKVAAGLVTVVLAVAIAGGSQWPVDRPSDDAFVRLSWRADPLRVEDCRTLTEEELEAIPTHMRRTEECVGGFVDYELTLEIDDRARVIDTIAPSGLRRDRPIYVLRDEPVAPGRHDVEVTFRALVPDDFESQDGPVVLRWSGEMALEAGQVGLVSLDPRGAALERRPGRTP